ncbi:antibiotic biosynthesis monooxygenase family protein [Paraliobacillus sediminis]|uniref:antibiotic biosynthesis monooxygenase family protein n=1 Tax=Paraliobacillus sediminis TaxID=1885916 RepID=UPI000E3E4EF0|nr:antibiotic biosynthesis monooxygenase [Paraliobacillus sediminis]
MKAYMTNGTLEYLEQIRDNYPAITMYFMRNNTSTTVYYEDTGISVFKEARSYTVISDRGSFQEHGYVVMTHIPVTDDGKPIFESEFKQRADRIEKVPGFYAFRVLRPLHGNTYVLAIQWDSEQSYQVWRDSDVYNQNYGKDIKPKYRAGKSFRTIYNMVDWDEVKAEREEAENKD